MPYLKLYVHCVWATKNREKIIRKDIAQTIYNHIIENATLKDIKVLSIGGYREHIHLLVSMNAVQNIAGIMNLIKGESSFWINRQKLIKQKFEWQDDYFAVSVSPAVLPNVISYIKNQEKHHKNKTFQEEYDEFMKSAGVDILKG